MQYENEYETVEFDGAVSEKEKPRRIRIVKRLPKSNDVPEIVKHTVEQALKKLQATGCAYQIMLSDGTLLTHKIELFNVRKRKNTDKPYAHGAIKEHYEPYIENLEPGGVAMIPCTDLLDLDTIRGSITAHLSQRWGSGSYTTYANRKTNMFEVMRLA